MSFRNKINSIVINSLRKRGFSLSYIKRHDIEDLDWKLYEKVKKLTMTPPDRVFSLIEAMKYIIQNDVPGDLVECGVWRGGNAVVMIELLKRYREVKDRNVWLYDTYDGMVKPEDVDVSLKGENATQIFNQTKNDQGGSSWSAASYDFVKSSLLDLEYDMNLIKLIKGKVEDTLIIDSNKPQKIAILRLDTDWYSSTKIEMEELFPLLTKGGVLIIDDYGDWQGSKKAVDEYILNNNVRIFLNRLSSGARIGVKD